MNLGVVLEVDLKRDVRGGASGEARSVQSIVTVATCVRDAHGSSFT